MVRRLIYALLLLVFLLRHDLWFWDDPSPVLGLPVGLTYHIGICLAAAVAFWLLVRVDDGEADS